MTQQNELEAIRDALKKNAPPHDIDLIREVAHIEWKKLGDNSVEIASEILLRVSADAIVCANDMDGRDREEYRAVFTLIVDNIRLSGVMNITEEFSGYFDKFILYVSDFDHGP